MPRQSQNASSSQYLSSTHSSLPSLVNRHLHGRHVGINTSVNMDNQDNRLTMLGAPLATYVIYEDSAEEPVCPNISNLQNNFVTICKSNNNHYDSNINIIRNGNASIVQSGVNNESGHNSISVKYLPECSSQKSLSIQQDLTNSDSGSVSHNSNAFLLSSVPVMHDSIRNIQPLQDIKQTFVADSNQDLSQTTFVSKKYDAHYPNYQVVDEASPNCIKGIHLFKNYNCYFAKQLLESPSKGVGFKHGLNNINLKKQDSHISFLNYEKGNQIIPSETSTTLFADVQQPISHTRAVIEISKAHAQLQSFHEKLKQQEENLKKEEASFLKKVNSFKYCKVTPSGCNSDLLNDWVTEESASICKCSDNLSDVKVGPWRSSGLPNYCDSVEAKPCCADSKCKMSNGMNLSDDVVSIKPETILHTYQRQKTDRKKSNLRCMYSQSETLQNGNTSVTIIPLPSKSCDADSGSFVNHIEKFPELFNDPLHATYLDSVKTEVFPSNKENKLIISRSLNLQETKPVSYNSGCTLSASSNSLKNNMKLMSTYPALSANTVESQNLKQIQALKMIKNPSVVYIHSGAVPEERSTPLSSAANVYQAFSQCSFKRTENDYDKISRSARHVHSLPIIDCSRPSESSLVGTSDGIAITGTAHDLLKNSNKVKNSIHPINNSQEILPIINKKNCMSAFVKRPGPTAASQSTVPINTLSVSMADNCSSNVCDSYILKKGSITPSETGLAVNQNSFNEKPFDVNCHCIGHNERVIRSSQLLPSSCNTNKKRMISSAAPHSIHFDSKTQCNAFADTLGRKIFYSDIPVNFSSLMLNDQKSIANGQMKVPVITPENLKFNTFLSDTSSMTNTSPVCSTVDVDEEEELVVNYSIIKSQDTPVTSAYERIVEYEKQTISNSCSADTYQSCLLRACSRADPSTVSSVKNKLLSSEPIADGGYTFNTVNSFDPNFYQYDSIEEKSSKYANKFSKIASSNTESGKILNFHDYGPSSNFDYATDHAAHDNSVNVSFSNSLNVGLSNSSLLTKDITPLISEDNDVLNVKVRSVATNQNSSFSTMHEVKLNVIKPSHLLTVRDKNQKVMSKHVEVQHSKYEDDLFPHSIHKSGSPCLDIPSVHNLNKCSDEGEFVTHDSQRYRGHSSATVQENPCDVKLPLNINNVPSNNYPRSSYAHQHVIDNKQQPASDELQLTLDPSQTLLQVPLQKSDQYTSCRQQHVQQLNDDFTTIYDEASTSGDQQLSSSPTQSQIMSGHLQSPCIESQGSLENLQCSQLPSPHTRLQLFTQQPQLIRNVYSSSNQHKNQNNMERPVIHPTHLSFDESILCYQQQSSFDEPPSSFDQLPPNYDQLSSNEGPRSPGEQVIPPCDELSSSCEDRASPHDHSQPLCSLLLSPCDQPQFSCSRLQSPCDKSQTLCKKSQSTSDGLPSPCDEPMSSSCDVHILCDEQQLPHEQPQSECGDAQSLYDVSQSSCDEPLSRDGPPLCLYDSPASCDEQSPSGKHSNSLSPCIQSADPGYRPLYSCDRSQSSCDKPRFSSNQCHPPCDLPRSQLDFSLPLIDHEHIISPDNHSHDKECSTTEQLGSQIAHHQFITNLSFEHNCALVKEDCCVNTNGEKKECQNAVKISELHAVSESGEDLVHSHITNFQNGNSMKPLHHAADSAPYFSPDRNCNNTSLLSSKATTLENFKKNVLDPVEAQSSNDESNLKSSFPVALKCKETKFETEYAMLKEQSFSSCNSPNLRLECFKDISVNKLDSDKKCIHKATMKSGSKRKRSRSSWSRKKKKKAVLKTELDEYDSDCDLPAVYSCGKCDDGNVFSCAKELQVHIYTSHNGMARRTGKSQVFTECQGRTAQKAVLAAGYKLLCEACGTSFKSQLGLEGHSKWCGKSAIQRVEVCLKCYRSFTMFTLKPHMKICEGTSEDYDKVDQFELNKRAKALKVDFRKSLRDKFLKLVEDTGDSQSGGMGAAYKNGIHSLCRKVYCCPVSVEEIKQKWFQDHQIGIKLRCYNSTCDYTTTAIEEIEQHCLIGKNLLQEHYSCKVCSLENSLLKEDMIAHLISNHSDEVKCIWQEENTCKIKTGKKQSCKMNEDIFSAALSFREEHFSDNLFPDWKVRIEEWLLLQNFSEYLPRHKMSPRYRIAEADKESWQTLSVFCARNVDDTSYMFCGGVITASAWCPTPSSVSEGRIPSQLIAVAASSIDTDIHLSNRSIHKEVIQLWNCTELDNINARGTPYLELGIAHNFGSVTCLQWCPSGIYENPDNDSSKIFRLGALAAACSNGDINVWIIPHPSLLQGSNEPSKCIFVKDPDIILKTLDFEENASKPLPFKIDWLPSKGHSLIASSMSDGSIVIWNLSSKSPLHSYSECRVLYPCNSIQGHLGAAGALAWCPHTGGDHLSTGGYDHMHHLWDTSNIPMRLSTVRKDVITDIKWPLNSTATVMAIDDLCFMYQSTTAIRECGYLGLNISYCRSDSSTWSVSFSDAINGVAQATDSGDCAVTIFKDLYKLASDKPKRHFRLYYKVEKKLIDTDHFMEGSGDHSSTVLHYGLVFYNSPIMQDAAVTADCPSQPSLQHQERIGTSEYESKDGTEKEGRSDALNSGMLQYPLESATSVAFNNNVGSHHWLFMGYRSGLARLVCLSREVQRK